MARPLPDEYFSAMAELVATRGTCIRRKVGCVLVNARKHVIATGYNGKAAGLPHCEECPCEGANAPSGLNLDGCEALHAESNALLQCKDIYDIETAYVTTSPCVHCTKLLLNTSCKRIVFVDEYPHSNSKVMWEKAGREWVHFNG